MAYSNLSTKDLKKNFGVTEVIRANVFAEISPRPISDWLKKTLQLNVIFALDQGTEKARSEFIIAPILVELRQQAEEKISIFSGVEFDVDALRGLTGRCDFLISRSAYQRVLEAPIVVAVEAKREDFDGGITQCAAEMIAARIYNEQEENPAHNIYGIVTTGDIWRFLALRGNVVEIEENPFDLAEIEQIMGILWAMTFDEVPPAKNNSK